MRIAVLSGKGGTGKTFVSTNLSVACGKSTYIDCDVEEPDGRLFLKPQDCATENVYTFLPAFDENKCTGCRKCVEFCHFNALVFVKGKPMVFPEVCHSCGGCSLLCPSHAIEEEKQKVGIIETGKHNDVTVITGVLDIGQASSVPVIKASLEKGLSYKLDTIIDCPPGSSCSVMECIMSCDCCVIVAEPTAFGFHNFKMVYELVTLLHKKLFVVINKESEPYAPLESFCKEKNISIILHIPYTKQFASLGSSGGVASKKDKNTSKMFLSLLDTIRQGVEK